MSDALVNDTAREERPRVGMFVWCLGLSAMVLVGAVLSFFAYDGSLSFDQLPQLDKLVHFTMCGAVVFFLDGVLRRRTLAVGRLQLPLAVPLVVVPAGIEELLQRFSPYRTSSVADFAADLAGATFFVWLSRRIAG